MKLTKLVWNFSYFSFSMIFCGICKISVFIEKEKNERKEQKACTGFVQPTTKPPNCKDLAQVEKEAPSREAHSDLDILHKEPRSISKTIKVIPPFLSL
jgi:hypothetical protein